MGDEEEIKNDKVKTDHANSQQSVKKRKKPKENAIFGNYRNYYTYRIDQGLEEDPRIQIMKKEWFEGRNCLDIGCNSGLITITIAKKFGCQNILGIDIDSARIEDANWNLRKHAKMSGTSSDLSDRVFFKKDNFVQSWSTPGEKYNTILCLSVSKWVHLNWGDEGLITLFSKVYRLLEPGGVFILEPQPWKSYISNRQVSEVASTNYKKLEIFPNMFQEILLDKIGFREIENLSASLSGSKTGFNRPVLALWK